MDLLRSIFKGDKVIWIIFLFLCLISVTEVFSAAASLSYKSGDHWAPITRHGILLMVGVGLMVVTHNIQYKWFSAIPVFLLPASIVLLVMVTAVGVSVGDASRWISVMGFTFQPSELAKMAVVIAVAYILSKGQNEHGASPNAFRYIMIITCLVCGLILPENLSTAALLFGVVYLMMIIGRVSFRKLLIPVIVVAGLVAAGVAFHLAVKNVDLQESSLLSRADTWVARIVRFMDEDTKVPAAEFKVTDQNAQVTHARIAVATSNIIGKGPGNSIQRDFLSLSFSDFIYAIILEELGLLPAAFVVFLYIVLLIRVGRIARKCDRTFPAFLVIGISLLLVSQAMFNMMVAVGLAPVTGQPLPLISMGGTSIWINCIYIGMILSVSRYTAKLDEQRAALEAQRLHDAQIPMEVTTGSDFTDNDFPTGSGFVTDAQTSEEPTSQMLNSDEEFE
ncbi:MAG: FtsW/RodA/SpoVE family cell cycle protein [Prevotellaceae bacterium]|jgi:cell division protein FtsW|nr:FtsW/RodA/SpoVE family cell cycle protein [Prevotellaceae bacterium]